MFESTCPGCRAFIDPNQHFKCPKCGYKFWNTREAFLKQKRLNPKIQDETQNKAVKERPENKSSHQPGNQKWWVPIILFIVSWVGSAYLTLIVLLVISLAFGAKCGLNSTDIICRTQSYFYLIAILPTFIIFPFLNRANQKNSNKISSKASSKSTEIVFCHKCRRKAEPDATYCIYCGTKLTK